MFKNYQCAKQDFVLLCFVGGFFVSLKHLKLLPASLSQALETLSQVLMWCGPASLAPLSPLHLFVWGWISFPLLPPQVEVFPGVLSSNYLPLSLFPYLQSFSYLFLVPVSFPKVRLTFYFPPGHTPGHPIRSPESCPGWCDSVD